MTIICAMHDAGEGCTWLGSDTQSTSGVGKSHAVPKWVICGEWALGYAGDLRAGNIIRASAEDLFHRLSDPFEFTVRLRNLLVEHGFTSDSNNYGCPSYGSSFILADPHMVWDICTGLSVEEIPSFWARGSGAAYARGAAFAIVESKSKERIMRLSMEAAIAFDEGCGGDIWLHKLEV